MDVGLSRASSVLNRESGLDYINLQERHGNHPHKWHENTKIRRVVGIALLALAVAFAAVAIGVSCGVAAIPIIAIVAVAATLGSFSLTSLIAGSVFLGRKSNENCPHYRMKQAKIAIEDIENRDLSYRDVRAQYAPLLQNGIINNNDLNKIYRGEAEKSNYQEFLSRHGSEILEILDETNQSFLHKEPSVNKDLARDVIDILAIPLSNGNTIGSSLSSSSEEAPESKYPSIVLNNDQEIPKNQDEANKESTHKSILEELKQTSYSQWMKDHVLMKYSGESESELFQAIGITSEQLNQHFREEVREGNYTSFILSQGGLEVLDILDEENKRFLRSSFIESLKKASYKASQKEIQIFSVSNEEINSIYREDAQKLIYTNFIAKHGYEILDILDEANITALFPTFLSKLENQMPGEWIEDKTRELRVFGVKVHDHNNSLSVFIKKYGIAGFTYLLSENQKEKMKSLFLKEVFAQKKGLKELESQYRTELQAIGMEYNKFALLIVKTECRRLLNKEFNYIEFIARNGSDAIDLAKNFYLQKEELWSQFLEGARNSFLEMSYNDMLDPLYAKDREKERLNITDDDILETLCKEAKTMDYLDFFAKHSREVLEIARISNCFKEEIPEKYKKYINTDEMV